MDDLHRGCFCMGIKIILMVLLFSWPCSQRFWTVGDFWTDNENLWRPTQTRSLSLWTGMILELLELLRLHAFRAFTIAGLTCGKHLCPLIALYLCGCGIMNEKQEYMHEMISNICPTVSLCDHILKQWRPFDFLISQLLKVC